MSELYDQNYYAKEIANEQIEDVDLKTAYLKTTKWDAFLNAKSGILIGPYILLGSICF